MVRTLNWVPSPKTPRVESSMDSREVAQNFVSPLRGGSSHWDRVCSIALACGECLGKEKKSRRFGSWDEEKGIESDSSLGRR